VPHTPAPAEARSADSAPEPRPAAARDDAAVQFVRRAVLAKLAGAAAASNGTALPADGFDAAFHLEGRKGMFRKAEPDIRVTARLVERVDGPAVEAAWPAAARLAGGDRAVCLLLLGSGLSAASELSASISALRRRTRGAPPLVIPVDIRDWQALMPPDTPPPVRGMLERLRQPD
jgi:hypothetical protein